MTGFKQRDIKPCAVCGKGLMHAGLPLFYRLRVERLGLNAAAIQRQAGLEQMLGGQAGLAQVMGLNEDMATVIDGPRDVLVCETCTHQHPILMETFLEPAAE